MGKMRKGLWVAWDSGIKASFPYFLYFLLHSFFQVRIFVPKKRNETCSKAVATKRELGSFSPSEGTLLLSHYLERSELAGCWVGFLGSISVPMRSLFFSLPPFHFLGPFGQVSLRRKQSHCFGSETFLLRSVRPSSAESS